MNRMNIERIINRTMEWSCTQSVRGEEARLYASKLLLEELKQTSAEELSKHLDIFLLKKQRRFVVTLSSPWNPTDSTSTGACGGGERR